MFKRLLLISLCPLLMTGVISAHDSRTDPELAELNDYMMAIQVLRHSDSDAELLFKKWQKLRENSWKIRELTDDEGLSIDEPEVVRQIEYTTSLRKELLRESRLYFGEQMDNMPSVRVQLGNDISISGIDSAIQTPVGSRQVVLVEFRSDRQDHSHLFLEGSESEEVLFWSKHITVTNSHPRYTFVYVAPLEAALSEVSISIQKKDVEFASFTVQGEGTQPATYSWYNHIPADSPTDIHHHDYDATLENQSAEVGGGIKFDIRHPDTGEPLPVRIEVRDEDGNSYWTPLRGPSYAVNRDRTGFQTPLWTFQTGPFFYIGGEASLGVEPEGKTATIYHGFEFKPLTIDVPGDGLLKATPERWINMTERGWYSGHTHIHTTDIGIPVQYSRFWPLVTQGEGLGVSAILTLQGERADHAIYSDEYPVGPLKSHSTENHLITFGEEYRNNPYGHLAFLGLDHLVLPLSSGSLGEMAGPDYPPNHFVLKDVIEQGGVTIGPHFGSSIMDDARIKSSWPSTGFEMPVDVALGTMHLAEIYGNAGQLEVWYKLLNCGFNIAATAGPDWAMKDTPRAYVYLGDQAFNVDNWLEGLKKGRSFITRGPMLFFTVNGQMPGSHLVFPENSQEITIDASALLPDESQTVEIVVNGMVVASGTDLSQTITVDDSSWIAARTANAHSNPVYVTIGNRPRGYAEEAEQFIDVIDRLEEWVNTKALFATTSQKETVLEILDRGRSVYNKIAKQARDFGRTSPYTAN